MQSEFDYHAEQAKVNFQANVSSLLELQSLIKKKISEADSQKRDGIFFTTNELTVIDDWLSRATTNILADYTLIDRTNRITNKLYTISRGMILKKTPNLKELTQ